MDLATAVKKLRAALNMSQQAFANELGLSIRAIANYEKDRIPEPKVLARLQQLAMKHRLYELNAAFHAALMFDVGLPAWFGISSEFESSDVFRLTYALIKVLEEEELTDKEKIAVALRLLYRIVSELDPASQSGFKPPPRTQQPGKKPKREPAPPLGEGDTQK
jgi:transcriptional regulator with XRE-family HTH domain